MTIFLSYFNLKTENISNCSEFDDNSKSVNEFHSSVTPVKTTESEESVSTLSSTKISRNRENLNKELDKYSTKKHYDNNITTNKNKNRMDFDLSDVHHQQDCPRELEIGILDETSAGISAGISAGASAGTSDRISAGIFAEKAPIATSTNINIPMPIPIQHNHTI